jgi:hypothetical protein
MKTTTIKRVIKLDSYAYFQKHLQLVNLLLPSHMTNKEIDVLARFLDIAKNNSEDTFSSDVRKQVIEKENISSQYISNILRSLTEKSVVIKEDNRYVLKSFLYPDDDIQQYQIAIINDQTE